MGNNYRGLILFMSLVIMVVGCENIQVSKAYEGSYNIHEEKVGYGNIELDIEELDGEISYSFEPKAEQDYAFQYDIHINEGEFKILVVASNEKILDEVPWTSEEYQRLKSENKDTILNDVGGSLSVVGGDKPISIIIQGKKATGKIRLSW
ncbi:hypothetical protein [Sutcliffiella deserti]|uniref:hypothetical protein n=1 Tax=Sutcliffiella deserti TaxID=2875501 RepID=UPI001CBBC08D|nr:hypothetical protein [Sutcliffiella deserti]